MEGSVVQVLSPVKCDVDILDDGRTIRDFIDDKIKELASAVSIRDIVSL